LLFDHVEASGFNVHFYSRGYLILTVFILTSQAR
jgi:hypothetical protein